MRRFAPPIAVAAIALIALAGGAGEPAFAATPYSFAVIGDVPYGSSQLAQLPNRIGQLNAAPNLSLVVHLGDITGHGSTQNCTDGYNATIRADVNRSVRPFVYTPGDNEWADCSYAGTGAANPLTRLGAVRKTFFSVPGRTLGTSPMTVSSQSASGYPENQSFDRGGLTITTLHLVGSNNDLSLWKGRTATTAAQRAEVTARLNADVSLVRSTFAHAKQVGSRAVVLLTQADMFAGSGSTYRSAFQPVVQAIAAQAVSFVRPVLLIDGDTHVYKKDKPLASGSSWVSYYGVTKPAPNLTRVVVKAGTTEWLRVTVVATSAVLQTQRVPFS